MLGRQVSQKMKYTERSKNRLQTRGPDTGYCAICGKYEKLVRDHIPPKGCGNLKDHELRLLVSRDPKRGNTSQGGTHFKTICTTCNSDRLGLRYDPELIALSKEITSVVKAAANNIVALPEVIQCEIKSQRISRAIVGHILAAASVRTVGEPNADIPMDNTLRAYFLDENSPFPEEWELYYWVYPSRKQIVAKYFGKRDIKSGINTFGHTIKFLPLGFYLIWKPKGELALSKLISNKSISLNSISNIRINIRQNISLEFPEVPHDDEIIVYNSNNAYKAEPKSPTIS